MEVLNKVKNLKTADTKTFLSWEFNTLKDSKRDVTKLKNAIRKSGWSFPVIVWNNFVIDGAGRKKAVEEMIKEGDTIPEIPYVEIEAENLQDAKSKALEVSSQFGEITKESFLAFTEDIEIDFDTFEIDGMSADAFIESDEKDDEVPEIPEDPKSKLGDLYELGEHRVLCGDSTKLEDVERLMDGKKADIVVTDPPYNTGMTGKNTTFDYDWGSGKKKSDEKAWLSHMFNDSYTEEEWAKFLQDIFAVYVTYSKGDCAFYVFIDWRRVNDIRSEMEKHMDVKNVIVWDKKVHGLGSDYKSTYELCIVGKKGKPEINNRFGLDYQDIWRLQREMGRNKDHATAKPVELLVKPISHASKADDIVMDLFLGSGSTLVAAQKTGRICYGMELDPKYIDVIVQRYVDYVDSPKVIKNGIDETHLWKKKTK